MTGPGGTAPNINSIFFTDQNTGYAVGDQGTILKTIDGGTNWINQNSGLNHDISLFSVNFPTTDTGYAVGGFDGVMQQLFEGVKTTNGGETWTLLNFYNGFPSFSTYFTSATTGYLLCRDSVVKTIDGGTSWTMQNTPTNKDLRSLYFLDPNIGYAVGVGGTILKTTTGGGTGLTELQDISRLLRIHPNPSSGFITIESEAPYCSYLTIMNINGIEVLNRTINKPCITIDIKNLPGGLYFLKVTEEKAVYVGKIIKE